MALDFTTLRPEIVYLRRRLKAGESLEPTSSGATSSASSPSSLKLRAPDEQVTVVLPDKPLLEDSYALSAKTPVLRLNKFQSSIGSLLVEGANQFAWDVSGRFGIVRAGQQGESNVPSFGNRKLVEFYKGNLVIGLRHFQQLRRVILTGQGKIVVKLPSGAEVSLNGDGEQNALYISRIKDVLEFRFEWVEEDSLSSTFSIY